MYHWGADTAIRREQTGYANGQGIWALILDVPKVIGRLEFQGIAASEREDAYPADGWVDGVKYVSAPKSQLSAVGKCVTGSYVGGGSAGEDSPNVLEFTFVPKTVEILGYSSGSSFTRSAGVMVVGGMATRYSGGTGVGGSGKRSEDRKQVSWYNSGADAQYNHAGYTYYYRALG